MRVSVFAALAAGVLAAGAGQAATVDFSGPAFVPGAIPQDITIGGTTISVSVQSRTNEARVLNTNDPSGATGYGNDPDLAGPFDDAQDADLLTDRSFGNILIIQEGGTSSILDDEGQGGSMFITFSRPVTLTEVAMVDIDSPLSIFLNGNTTAAATGQTDGHGAPNGVNKWYGFDLNTAGVTEMELRFQGSGGLGEFSFTADPPMTPVPVPGGLPLLLGGAACLGLMTRSRGL